MKINPLYLLLLPFLVILYATAIVYVIREDLIVTVVIILFAIQFLPLVFDKKSIKVVLFSLIALSLGLLINIYWLRPEIAPLFGF